MNDFLASFNIRSCLVGFFFGEERVSSDNELSLVKIGLGGGLGVFRGENSSFQSLITS